MTATASELTASIVSVLVVNADDFGLTEGHNRAIIDAHSSGIVTSTSLLANGEAFDHAVSLARELPSLGVGVHLTLTEGLPVAPGGRALTGPDGKLPLSNQPFARALLTGRLPREAIRREFAAQIDKVIKAGIKPTHVDGHKYIHLLPGITAIVAELARQAGIPVMRVPHRLIDTASRPARLPGLLAILLMGTLAYRTAQQNSLACSDRVAGFVDTGHLHSTAIRSLLHERYPGVTELLCHPAYRSPHLQKLLARGYEWIATYDFEKETAAVSDPALRADLTTQGWTFADFGTMRSTATLQKDRS